MFRNIQFLLLMSIMAVSLLGQWIPLPVKMLLYSLSMTLKSVIVFVLPIIIFGLLFKTVVRLSGSATKIIGLVLVSVCVSNFVATFTSHYVGEWVYGFDMSMQSSQNEGVLLGLWDLVFPTLISNDKALFSGLILGLLSAKFFPKRADQWASKSEQYVSWILRGFMYIIPVFILGFVVKLEHDGVMGLIVQKYTFIFAAIAISQLAYTFVYYVLVNKGAMHRTFMHIRNMLPAAISGFTSMSSAASMPLTIVGVERSSDNKDLAKAVVPMSVNIHLVGDCFAIPILAYAILKTFNLPEPSLVNYLIFTGYFVAAKFSVAAVPGGGILVMLPILETYLGFNGEMLSIITALYILFDPVITGCNVLGNGAFAKLIDVLSGAMTKSKSCKIKAEA